MSIYGVYYLETPTSETWYFAFADESRKVATKLLYPLRQKYDFYATRLIKDCIENTVEREHLARRSFNPWTKFKKKEQPDETDG